MKYQTKPVVVEAMQWTGENATELVTWLEGGWRPDGTWLRQVVLEDGTIQWALVLKDSDDHVRPGDFVVKKQVEIGMPGAGVMATHAYRFTADKFAETYEPAP